MKKRYCLQLAVLFLIWPLILQGRTDSGQGAASLKLKVEAKTLIKELETSIPALMQEANIPGLQIAVIRDGKLLWHGSFGVKNAQTREPVEDNTVFEAASLTKPFFAYLVLKMVEKGELDLDKPLVECAPQDYIEDRYIRHKMDLDGFRRDWFCRITSRMVLSHSSGLPHGGPRRPLPVLFEPGTQYRYSADGYMYLQRIIEFKKDKPLELIMQEDVIEPLKSKTVDTMLTPQVDVDKNIYWSLGFGIDRFVEGDAFWQWGDYGIFRNYIMAFKRQRIGVVYLTNSFNGLSIGSTLIEHAIGADKVLGLRYLGYPSYDSPAFQLTQKVHSQGIDEAVTRYHSLRKENPQALSEVEVNSLGYALLQADKKDEAIVFFKLNVEAYPYSANTYDSLAEAYMQNKNTELAIQYYRKALEMIPKDPRPDKAYLENLRKGALENLSRLEKLKK